MLKNPTPQQITFHASTCITIGVFAVFLLSQFTGVASTSSISILMISISAFIVSYIVILYYLRTYIYRKIKLIYKNIHRFKSKQVEKKNTIDIKVNIIDRVEQKVAEWAADKEQEIESMRAMEKYRRNFLGNISHELKTPIFNIQGFIHTLLDGALYDPDINVNYLKRAAKNVDRLNTIIEDLESISRFEAGQLILDVETFSIKILVEEVFEDLEIKAKDKNISLFFKEGADKDFMVNADKESIRQVLMNIVVNSIKYGQENGRTKVSFYDMEKFILVEVADNGIGIPEKHLKHLFDRFYRVDKSRSRKQGGSGLGLSIVKHIIEAHKQTINVRSSDNLGATFGFTLEKNN